MSGPRPSPPRKLLLVSLAIATGMLLPPAGAQVHADWDFGALVNPGTAGAPLADPLLDASEAGASSAVTCSDLTGESASATYQGLLWAASNPAPGELNLRYWDGDLSDSGTNGDGVNDNYIAFTLTPNAAPIQVARIAVSTWRNGAGAVDAYAIEVVVNGGAPAPFGTVLVDSNTADFGYDWFEFSGSVTATTSLEVRFRPASSPGVAGTGNLHVNGLRVEGPEDGSQDPIGPNVLFLIADDLTANALACYGNDQVLTPNIDALAARGMLFERAYCQYPVCASSRASMLAGLYTPRLAGAGGSYRNLDAVLGDHSTLPEHFKLSGYTSARVSKLYHMRVPGDITAGVAGQDHVPSWDITFNALAPEWMTTGLAAHYTNENLIFSPDQHYNLGFGAAFYTVEADTTGDEQADVLSTDRALELMDDLRDESFFLAVGFVRPHVPLVAPAAYYAPYDAQAMDLATSVPNDLLDIPSAGVFWNEPVRGPFNDDARRHVLRAYYASVTFMDAQVGRLMDRLQELELLEDTIVVFTSDHGYHLGEHTMWQKLSLHEESARVPLIVAGPDIASGRTDALSELIDLYPTLADLADLPLPPDCQGLSLRPVLADPTEVVRNAAFSMVSGGHLLRTDDWAYMRYGSGAEELYDMRAGGDRLQFENLAGNPAYAGDLELLGDQLTAKLLAVSSDSGSAYCFGDGSGAACPCGASGGQGEGCLNSSGQGATLAGGGSADVSSDGFFLTIEGGPPGVTGFLVDGTDSAAAAFGGGLLCLTPLRRYGPKDLDETGSTSFSGLGSSATSGLTLRYQFLFRDIAGSCGSFNSTNGWTVTWH